MRMKNHRVATIPHAPSAPPLEPLVLPTQILSLVLVCKRLPNKWQDKAQTYLHKIAKSRKLGPAASSIQACRDSFPSSLYLQNRRSGFAVARREHHSGVELGARSLGWRWTGGGAGDMREASSSGGCRRCP